MQCLYSFLLAVSNWLPIRQLPPQDLVKPERKHLAREASETTDTEIQHTQYTL